MDGTWTTVTGKQTNGAHDPQKARRERRKEAQRLKKQQQQEEEAKSYSGWGPETKVKAKVKDPMEDKSLEQVFAESEAILKEKEKAITKRKKGKKRAQDTNKRVVSVRDAGKRLEDTQFRSTVMQLPVKYENPAIQLGSFVDYLETRIYADCNKYRPPCDFTQWTEVLDVGLWSLCSCAEAVSAEWLRTVPMEAKVSFLEVLMRDIRERQLYTSGVGRAIALQLMLCAKDRLLVQALETATGLRDRYTNKDGTLVQHPQDFLDISWAAAQVIRSDTQIGLLVWLRYWMCLMGSEARNAKPSSGGVPFASLARKVALNLFSDIGAASKRKSEQEWAECMSREVFDEAFRLLLIRGKSALNEEQMEWGFRVTGWHYLPEWALPMLLSEVDGPHSQEACTLIWEGVRKSPDSWFSSWSSLLSTEEVSPVHTAIALKHLLSTDEEVVHQKYGGKERFAGFLESLLDWNSSSTLQTKQLRSACFGILKAIGAKEVIGRKQGTFPVTAIGACLVLVAVCVALWFQMWCRKEGRVCSEKYVCRVIGDLFATAE